MRTRSIEISTGSRSESMVLPINPASISISMGQKNQTLDLLAVGEVLMLGNRALSSLSFTSFFPAAGGALYRYADRPPWDYFNLLERWRVGRRVVRIIVGGSQINMAAAIEKLTPELREGDKDLYYTLELKEYRQLNVPALQHQTTQQYTGLLERPDVSQKPAYHIVRSAEDTFWCIACRYYGDGTKWKMIADANGRELAYDVYVGDRIVLP